MTTARHIALLRNTDPVTARIYTTLAEQGRAVAVVAGLAGIEDRTWRLRARTGRWRTKEVQAIAEVLSVQFQWLVDALNDTDTQVGAA